MCDCAELTGGGGGGGARAIPARAIEKCDPRELVGKKPSIPAPMWPILEAAVVRRPVMKGFLE